MSGSSPYPDPFVQFGELDLDFGDDRPTWPPPGIRKLVIKDKYEPLFTSATWTIVATVDGDEFAKSSQKDKAHTDPFIKRWARQLIRSKYEKLRQLGVDAEDEYVKWGGDLDDLKP
jgi:hypothetical protein